jgi:hypothetical protein
MIALQEVDLRIKSAAASNVRGLNSCNPAVPLSRKLAVRLAHNYVRYDLVLSTCPALL